MKLRYFLILFVSFVVIYGCKNTDDIISKHYQNEMMIKGTFKAEFDIRLENVGYSKKTARLVERLVYQGKNFDEYFTLAQEEFIKTINVNDFLPIIGKDGNEYYNQSYFNESYNILHYNDSYIIIEYNKYYVFSSAAHSNIWTEYFIIDIAQERLLGINDIATPLPDDFLYEMIKEDYRVDQLLRDNIWPPDTININHDSVELVWNVYTITPYSDGIINIVLQNDSFLTKKGKAIKAKIR
ncbi:hypothetical protein R84B8_01702 [Treponema sp. R8-4-B8]